MDNIANHDEVNHLREFCAQHFTEPLLSWYERFGRKTLPWQSPYDPYKVWISEIMLQQTQVKTVIPYFTRFLNRFPTIQALSQASEDEVLALWSGLGYYSRARHLHRTAQIVSTQWNGNIPEEMSLLITLPGIGASTAAAIRSLAFQKPSTILDGNVKRVLSRYFLVKGAVNQPQTKQRLYELASLCVSVDQPRAYTQAIMDLGATCCTPKNPSCTTCPMHQTCQAYLQKQTDKFPEKAPRKLIPQKTMTFLLQHTENTVYLEKRSDEGIWGGLWCLPMLDEAETKQEPQLFLKIKHLLTHFRLNIEIFRQSQTPFQVKHEGAWFTQEATEALGLPKPMRSALDAHWTQEDEKRVNF